MAHCAFILLKPLLENHRSAAARSGQTLRKTYVGSERFDDGLKESTEIPFQKQAVTPFRFTRIVSRPVWDTLHSRTRFEHAVLLSVSTGARENMDFKRLILSIYV